jgi:DNA-binding LacI/PurR family transcriptional regulator
MGFEPNLYAQRLRGGDRHDTIALCTGEDLGVMMLTRWALNNALHAEGWKVDMHSKSQYSVLINEEQSILLEQLRRLNPAAIIFDGNHVLETTEKQLLRYAEDGGILISFETPSQLPCDQVNFDSSNSAYIAAKHLLELGHRDIGLAIHGGTREDLLVADWFHGFQSALAEFGVHVNHDWLWHECCYEAAGASLGHKFLALKNRPTAMCIINDAATSAFVNVLLQNGLKVPDDVSIVSHDDVQAARYAIVPLTTVAFPIDKIVTTVMEMLKTRLDGSYQGAPRSISLPGELILRQSTRVLA